MTEQRETVLRMWAAGINHERMHDANAYRCPRCGHPEGSHYYERDSERRLVRRCRVSAHADDEVIACRCESFGVPAGLFRTDEDDG